MTAETQADLPGGRPAGVPADDQIGHEQEIRAMAAEIAAGRYAPKAAEWDANRTPFPEEERRFLGSAGLLGIALPERFGGSGPPPVGGLIVLEELAKPCRPAAFQVFEANTGPAQVVNLLGTETQRARYLPDIVAGRRT